jgi:hypothetical protein
MDFESVEIGHLANRIFIFGVKTIGIFSVI